MNAQVTRNRINERLLTIIAFIFAAAYVLYCAIFWGGQIAGGNDVAVLAVYILMPHLIATAVAFVLTALALFLGKSWWNLAAGIVYIVAICCFPAYWFFLVVPCVLSFFAFWHMHRQEKAAAPQFQGALDQKLDAQSVDSPNKAMEELVDEADARAEAGSDK
ncbi:hypothetical protein [Caniella muris]|uniref:hypothetical protein n=1 Tax=Caniella muris TaxID=2941502 RepID=UPI00203EEC3B|nr:hypothetical protein [Caniella muris]